MTAMSGDVGLPGYLVEKRARMTPAAEYAATVGVPRVVESMRARARVAGRSGVRQIAIRDFTVTSDSGPDFAGHDLGPSSPELLLGALASCLAHTWLIHAALQDVALAELEVGADAEMQSAVAAFPHPELPDHPFNIRYEVSVGYRGDPVAVQRLHDTVQLRCPLLNLLRRAVPIEGRLVVTKPST
jgi:uncharacterized OsmC-like protein